MFESNTQRAVLCLKDQSLVFYELFCPIYRQKCFLGSYWLSEKCSNRSPRSCLLCFLQVSNPPPPCAPAERPCWSQEYCRLPGFQHHGDGIEGCVGGFYTYGLLQRSVKQAASGYFVLLKITPSNRMLLFRRSGGQFNESEAADRIH